jgi:8-oxo-dGTP pyrophosphatase MutT (NUDIX family)
MIDMRTRAEAQAVIVRRKEGKTEFLLLERRYLDVAGQPVQWRLVKGGMEAGETPEETARREVGEEVGLERITVGKKLGHYEFEADGILHRVDSFLIEASGDKMPRVDSTEEVSTSGKVNLDAARWVRLEEALKLLTFSQEREMVERAAGGE